MKRLILLILLLFISIGLFLFKRDILLLITSFRGANEADLESSKKPLPTKTYKNDKYGFTFEYPNDWTLYDNTKNQNTHPLELHLYPVPEGSPTGDAFYSEVAVIENVTDVKTTIPKFTKENLADFIKLVNDNSPGESMKESDIAVTFNNTTVAGKPAVEQIERIKCSTSPTCHLLGWPTGYEKWVAVANKNNAVRFYVTTYFENDNTVKLDKIINTLKFTK